ncbi:MAG: hypothetical protein K8R44_06940 [Sulfurimonas sp.]|nr:hypothetical protein [Sulfurimonas sp.]
MKEKNLSLEQNEYKELLELDNDEFYYASVYELAIRAARNDIIYLFNLIDVRNNDIVMTDSYKDISFFNQPKPYISKITGQKTHFNSDVNIEEILKFIDKQLFMKWGLSLGALHLEYSFIPKSVQNKNRHLSERKESILKIGTNKKIKMSKYDKFTRKEITDFTIVDKEIDYTDYGEIIYKKDIKPILKYYEYSLNYKRGYLGQYLEEDKKILMQIDVHAPKKVILEQIEKLIDEIKEDEHNITSGVNIHKELISDNFEFYEYEASDLKSQDIKDKKKSFVEKLFMYDYYILRNKEIEIENKSINKKRTEKKSYIQQSFQLSSNEKREQLEQININYPNKLIKDIYQEIADITFKSHDTVENYIKKVKYLIKDKNYLQLLNGKPLK